jgi:hypothetical protein
MRLRGLGMGPEISFNRIVKDLFMEELLFE